MTAKELLISNNGIKGVNIRFPRMKTEESVKMYVAFIVNVDGRITGKRIIYSNYGVKAAEQFLDIVDDFKWTPGTCNNKTVPTLYVLPLNLCINMVRLK